MAAVVYEKHIWVSTDFGATWVEQITIPTYRWQAVAVSGDGSTIVAVSSGGRAPYGGGLLISRDGGATWLDRTPTSVDGPSYFWSVAVSSNGQSILAGTYHLLFTSKDGGETWTEHPGPAGPGHGSWQVAMSADGTRLAALNNNPAGYGAVWTSADGGGTWSRVFEIVYGTQIVSSADGTRLLVGQNYDYVPDDGRLYISTDGGASWSSRTQPGRRVWYTGLASSADGSVLLASEYLGALFQSWDGGDTFY